MQRLTVELNVGLGKEREVLAKNIIKLVLLQNLLVETVVYFCTCKAHGLKI